MLALQSIKISNFKTFKDFSLDLKSFNAVIGRNSCGKSNFVEALKFIANIAKYGVKTAVMISGGATNILNSGMGRLEPLEIEIISNPSMAISAAKKSFITGFKYSVKLDFAKNNVNYKFEEHLNVSFKGEKLYKAEFTNKNQIVTVNSNIKAEKTIEDFEKWDAWVFLLNISKKKEWATFNDTIFNDFMLKLILGQIKDFLSGFSIFNFNPALAKKTIKVAGNIRLNDDGSNLSEIANQLFSDDKKHDFLELINVFAPEIKDIKILNLADGSVLLSVKESNLNKYIPCSSLSDGTINSICLAAALCNNKSNFITLEEPEKNIHPRLMFSLVKLLKDQAEHKGIQFLLTTHNPELVSRLELDDVILMLKDKNGFSTIKRPSEDDWVNKVINEESLTFEDIFRQELF
jgi:predicted ATPase